MEQQTQVVFKDRDDAAFFYGIAASMSIFDVVDVNRKFLRIAPLVLKNGIVTADTDNIINVGPSEVEVA